MSLPAARMTDLHVCPAWCGPGAPHTGGPIAKGVANVQIGGINAARVGDATTCAGPPGAVTTGSATVHIGGQPAARMTDLAGHGGVILPPCCPNVLIGGPAPPAPPPSPPEPQPPEDEAQE